MEKVAEQRILQKHSKCSRFGVMSTLLKVATIAITHLAMVLGVKQDHCRGMTSHRTTSKSRSTTYLT